MQFINESKPNQPWEFLFQGSRTSAERFVNRIRTCISRIRNRIRESGKATTNFKLHARYIPIDPYITRVVLTRTHPVNRLSSDLQKLEIEFTDNEVL